jgi:hypothetical protein
MTYEWKYEHRVAHERYLSGKPPHRLSLSHSQRLEYEFANAVRQRREQDFNRHGGPRK